MLEYIKYAYIYPPRPIVKITPAIVSKFDTVLHPNKNYGSYVCQPKFNGSASVLFLNEDGFVKIMNRHNEPFSQDKLKPAEMDFKGLYRGKGWMVLNGELLNKQCRDENGKLGFNQQFIIYEILVYNNEYLIGSTLEERLKLLDELYPSLGKKYNHVIEIGVKGCYKTATYEKDFAGVYADIIKTDLYEGLVLKRKNAKLELGFREKNNISWNFKCRKPHKNYRY